MNHAFDRRAFTRAPHRARAVVSTGRGEFSADVLDISVAGLRIDVRGSLERGEFVRVRLQLAEGDTWIDPDALVVRTEPSPQGDGNRVGLSFLGLQASTREQLSRRVSQALTSAHVEAGARAPVVPVAPRADVRAPRPPGVNRRLELASSHPRAAQRRPERAPATPSPAVAKPTRSAPPAPAAPVSLSDYAKKLASLIGAGRDTPKTSARVEAPKPELDVQVSRAELRDLFRAAVASVSDDERK